MPETFRNHLSGETSPYLLQHARNPVDWHPWGYEALSRARRENKLLVISIGYAACHWCHVMEHESFSDPEVANLMNRHFISIKVDREERPDIDQLYMQAAFLATGRGGWPLNVIALPDQRPVYAGTYFPRHTWLEVLRYFSGLYTRTPGDLVTQSEEIMKDLKGILAAPGFEPDTAFDKALLNELVAGMEARLDRTEGGTLGAPKFPMPPNLSFLQEYAFLARRDDLMEYVYHTLRTIASGGLYDQLGGGFCRYSTDPRWRIPHFEKMLYDNAQLLSLYADACRNTGEPELLDIVRETASFIDRELTSPEGLFWSSLDADSEGEEGRFYAWTAKEFDRILGRDSAWAREFFGVSEEGNWEGGKNVLFRAGAITGEPDRKRLQRVREKLLQYRSLRPRPATDNKILTSWNGLMIKGYAEAWKATGENIYRDRALRAASFFADRLDHNKGRLHRSYTRGIPSIPGFLDDYAALLSAFTALYEITFESAWLRLSEQVAGTVFRHFTDPGSGLFRLAADDAEDLAGTVVETTDTVIPSSNSLLAHALTRLGSLTGRDELRGKGHSMLRKMLARMQKDPAYHAHWSALLAERVYPGSEIYVVGPAYAPLLKELHRHYLPGTVFSGGFTGEYPEPLRHKLVPGKTLIYVCRGQTCLPPVSTVGEALEAIRAAD